MSLKYKYAALGLVVASALLMQAPAQAEPLRLTRDVCRSMALKSSETVRKAENSLRSSELDVKIAKTAYLPKLEGSATAMYMLPDIDMMGAKMQVRGAYMAGLQLVQPIYAGGKITAGRKLASIGRSVAGEQLRMSRMDVIADADNAYWTYVAVLDKVSLMDAYMSMMDTLYAQTDIAVQAGMAIENDLLRIKAKMSEIEYQRSKARNGADLCRQALCNIIGADMDSDIVIADSVPAAVEQAGIADTDISSRPELMLLHRQVEAARQQVNMVRGDFLPVVGLSLGYTYYGNIRMKGMVDAGGGNYVPYSQEYRDGIGMGVLSVSIPLFHWGEGVKKVRKARIDVDNARLDLERNSRLMDLEARQASINVSDGLKMVEVARLALEEAEGNLRVMRDRYEMQMSTLTDLLDAQTQWQQSRSNLIEAVTQYQIYITAWQRATGRLE